MTHPAPPDVSAFVERLVTARWMTPDPSLECLDGEALAWLDARADEHLAALLPVLPEGAPDSLRVETARSVEEAAAALDAAWSTGADSWHARALAAALATLGPDLDAQTRAQLHHAVVMSLYTSAPWLRDELQYFANRDDDRPTPEVVAGHDLRWRARWGDTTPSPWAPLLAIWERGAWPTALPDGALLVFVPRRSVEATALGAPLPTSPPPENTRWGRQARPAPWTTRLPTLSQAGLDPILHLDAVLLPDAPIMMAGAVMPITPLPPLEVPPPDEPWYRRMWRRVTG